MISSSASVSLGGRWLQFEQENVQLKRIIAHLNNEILGLKRAYANDIELVSAHRNALNEAEESMESLREECSNAKKSLLEERKSRIERESIIEAQIQEFRRLTNESEAQQRKANEESEKYNSLDRTLADRTAVLSQRNHEISEMKISIRQQSERIEEIFNEWKNQKEKIEKLEFALKTKNDQCGKLIKEKNHLKELIGWKNQWEKENPGKKGKFQFDQTNKKEKENQEINSIDGEDEENDERNKEIEELKEIEKKNQENEKFQEIKENSSNEEIQILNPPFPIQLTNEPTVNTAEEIRYYRSTIKRQQRHIQLLEEKIKEIESKSRILQRDNQTLTIRFKNRLFNQEQKNKKKNEAESS